MHEKLSDWEIEELIVTEMRLSVDQRCSKATQAFHAQVLLALNELKERRADSPSRCLCVPGCSVNGLCPVHGDMAMPLVHQRIPLEGTVS